MSSKKPDKTAAGEGEKPSQAHIAQGIEAYGVATFGQSHAHDRADLGVCRADGKAAQRGKQKAERGGKIGAKALVRGQLHHIHSNGFDDPPTAE